MLNQILKNKGSAILIVLGLMVMLTGIAIISVSRSNTDMDLSDNQSKEERAFYLAESGIARATAEINQDNSWNAGYYKQILEGGHYTVALADSNSEPALLDSVLIHSTGIYVNGTAKIDTWLIPVYRYPFKYGMFAGQGMNFDRNTCIDSYNSDSGIYATTQDSQDGDIGTNGSIITSQTVTIGGDAKTALGGSITLGPGSQILGDTSTTEEPVNLDIIPQSEFDWAQSASNAPGGLSGSRYTYNASTKTLVTGSSGNVVLQSGVYYFSSITLGKLSNIVLAPDATVTIYVTGDLTLNQFSTVNVGGAPSDLQIYSQNGSLDFTQSNVFYGTYYGPNGLIQFDQTSQVYGSIVGDSIKLDQGACFHYDRSLSKMRHGTTGEMKTVAWRQIE